MPDDNPNLMTIFAEALERTDPTARAAYLDTACEGNTALRQRVEALLAAHDGAGRFLEAAFNDLSETTPPETHEAPRAFIPETPPPSQRVNGEQRSDSMIATIEGPAPASLP
jgi:hypothetical protein